MIKNHQNQREIIPYYVHYGPLPLKSNITDIQISCDLLNKCYRNTSDLGTFQDTFEFEDTFGDSPEATNRFQDMTRCALEPPGPELYNASGINFSK